MILKISHIVIAIRSIEAMIDGYVAGDNWDTLAKREHWLQTLSLTLRLAVASGVVWSAYWASFGGSGLCRLLPFSWRVCTTILDGPGVIVHPAGNADYYLTTFGISVLVLFLGCFRNLWPDFNLYSYLLMQFTWATGSPPNVTSDVYTTCGISGSYMK